MAKTTLMQPGDVADSIQEIILRELRNYFFVGGMPEFTFGRNSQSQKI